MSSLTSYAEANVKLNPLYRGWQRFLSFLFPPESDTWLTVFRIGQDGKLDFVRKYDIDVGERTMWWMGMVGL